MKRLLAFIGLVLFVITFNSCGISDNSATKTVLEEPPVMLGSMSASDVTDELTAIRVLLITEGKPLTWANYHQKFFAYHVPVAGVPPIEAAPFSNSWFEDWGGMYSFPIEVTSYFVNLAPYRPSIFWYRDL